MIETKINCDSCDQYLNAPTLYDVDYYLTLSQDSAPHKRGSPVYDVYIHPILKDGDKHFCGLKCLQNWLNKENP